MISYPCTFRQSGIESTNHLNINSAEPQECVQIPLPGALSFFNLKFILLQKCGACVAIQRKQVFQRLREFLADFPGANELNCFQRLLQLRPR